MSVALPTWSGEFFAGQADAVEARQERRAVQLPDHRIDLTLEGERLGERLDVEDADRLAGIGRGRVVLVEIDDIGAFSGAVQRAGQ